MRGPDWTWGRYGPASASLPDPPPSAWASGHASSASEHVTDGVSGGRAAALPSSHTDWRPQCPPHRPRGPGCCLTRTTRRAAGCGGPSPVQPAEARKVSPPRRGGGPMGQDAAPTSSLGPGRPQHSARGWGQLLLGAKPRGAQSHIPRRRPRPPSTSTLLSTSGNAALYAPLASSSLRPGAASGVGSRRRVTCTPLGTEALLPAAPRGRPQSVPLTPWVILLLKRPSKVVWGPGPSLSSFPSFIYVSVYKLEWGPPRGQGSAPQPPGVTRRGFWLEPAYSVGLDLPSPHQGPHCEVLTALNPLLFYLLNLI